MQIDRKQIVFFVFGGFFITNALMAELMGGKLIVIPVPQFFEDFVNSVWGTQSEPIVMSAGILQWPIVFVATDVINEFFGRRGVRIFTLTTVGLIIYAFFVLALARWANTASFSPVSYEAFDQVFGTSQWIIVGSIIAFLVSQLLDVVIFSRLRRFTGEKKLWLRATGSTVVSQLIDTFIVLYIGFVLPGAMNMTQYFGVSSAQYFYKVIIAILITPLCYAGHAIIYSYLGRKEASNLVEEAHPKRAQAL